MMASRDGVLHLADVAAATGGVIVNGAPTLVIDAVFTDSRAAAAGGLFAALRGPRHDGHAFLSAAAAAGAAAALVDQPVEPMLPLVRVPDVLSALLPLSAAWRARFPAAAIGVTGSAGKTTTVRLLAGMLAREAETHASRASWNAEIGVPLTVFGLRPEHRYVVVEMGMRGRGHIAALCAAVRPTIGVVTNVGESHLEALGTMDAVARAKRELIDALPPGGTAVLNADDPWVRVMPAPDGVAILRFGFGRDADVRAEALTMDAGGSRFDLITPHGTAPVRLAVPGRHLVADALAAAAGASAAGIGVAAIAAAIATFKPPPMRLEMHELADRVLLVDDAYNASPASLRAALETVAALRGRRRLVVALGEMLELGALRDAAHAEAGALVAAQDPAHLVAVGDAGRIIADAALRAGLAQAATQVVPDAADAAAALAACVRGGDIVLVKGSRGVGMDRAVAALRERFASKTGATDRERARPA